MARVGSAMIYLASPYSDPDPAVQEQRFDATCAAAGYLIGHGRLLFSPIAHSHPIAQRGGLQTDYAYWSIWNRQMIKACDELWVLMLDGWETSAGVLSEVSEARALNKLVAFVQWDGETTRFVESREALSGR